MPVEVVHAGLTIHIYPDDGAAFMITSTGRNLVIRDPDGDPFENSYGEALELQFSPLDIRAVGEAFIKFADASAVLDPKPATKAVARKPAAKVTKR